MGLGLEQNFSLFFRFDYDRKLLETAIQNEIQMKEIMKTFNTALQGIKGKYNNQPTRMEKHNATGQPAFTVGP